MPPARDTDGKPATTGRARGLERAFAILDYLRAKRGPQRPNEIATGIGAPRSSVYELVSLMLGNGVLEEGLDGRVYLGRKLFFLGSAYAEHFDLGREADVLLRRLAAETRETSQLCMLDGDKYTVAMMREGARAFRISSDVGERVPIPWTASGRLLVSHLSDDEILTLIPPEDFVLPDGKRLEHQVFIDEVRKASAAGYYAFQSITDTFTRCFAVPVFGIEGDCIATVCLVTPRDDGARNHDAYVEALKRAAEQLSHHTGDKSPHQSQ